MVSFGRSSRSYFATISFALAVVPLGIACSSSSAPLSGGDTNSDDASTADDSSSPAHDARASETGSSSGSDGGGGRQRVKSNIKFASNGLPECEGTTGCDLTTDECCLATPTSATCIAQSATCGSTANPAANFKCVEDIDCKNGQVCCAVANTASATAGSECQTVKAGGKCSPADSSSTGSVQLCQTDAECVGGEKCSWQTCNINNTPGVFTTLQLTMCGSPQGAPFYCSAH